MNGSKKKIKEWREEFVEKGAAIEHDRWARWQKYFFSKCDMECEGEKCFLTLPSILLMRWQRQIDTPYAELSEQEKESDRKETRNYLPLVALERKRVVEEIMGMAENGKFKANGETFLGELGNGANNALSLLQEKVKAKYL